MQKITKEVMAAAMFHGGKVLVMRRAPFMSWPGSWEFPGGKLEPGETAEQCLSRELREELSIEASVGPLVAENSHPYDFGTVHLSVFLVTEWSGEFSLIVHDDMRWVPLNELPGFPGLLPADIPVAKALRDKLSHI